MGTLKNQTIRAKFNVLSNDLSYEIEHVKQLAKEHGIDVSEAIKLLQILEYRRRTDFMIDNGDRHDEQLAGFAELIEKFLKDQE